jgi:hypothetical protein
MLKQDYRSVTLFHYPYPLINSIISELSLWMIRENEVVDVVFKEW